MTETTPNAELAWRVLDHIDAHPESWDQNVWGCGTAACFAGWAVRLSGGVIAGERNSDAEVVDTTDDSAHPLVGLTVEEAAYAVLGLDDFLSIGELPGGGTRWLFFSGNNRHTLGHLVTEIFGPRPEPTGGES